MEIVTGKNPSMALDKIDRQILGHLQENAKFDMQQLSALLHMTKTPIYKRIVALEQAGYISKYVALLDRKKVGFPLLVFCAVSLNIQNADYIAKFNEQVKLIDEIVECYLTGGVFDFILKVIVSDLEAYNNFASNKLATIPNVGKIQSSFVLTEVKSSTAIPF
ncbi:Lrp/AsnC family transcriptional regulator [Dyadobacter koreensis]|uniref:Lrp/AsnC family transcriptional regulator n=1 Tax=Dyadobacter koreensis TaxID=408657 RepID=A0A1H6T0J9_9BACT|nr:Lrp/AsnC family transcriptional regulator [Dyadobacter koreensis]SEI69770.1 Lrp/AsnC family transcriptional regulator [Dyadobacter koreensis]